MSPRCFVGRVVPFPVALLGKAGSCGGAAGEGAAAVALLDSESGGLVGSVVPAASGPPGEGGGGGGGGRHTAQTMPGFTCCVPGCYNNSHRDKALHFYTFPKDAELRRLWLKNVSRAGVSGCFSTFQPTTGHRVCSEHFPGGRKSYLVRVPTIFPLRGVNERKGARGARRPRHAPAAAQVAAQAAAAQAAVLLTLQEGAAAQAGQGLIRAAAGGGGGGSGGVPGEDVKPIDLTVQVELGGPGAMVGAPVHLAFLADNGPLVDSPPDHSYSLSSGTTSEELLRKLNEQRDIIALLEVKMKEMKGSIRRLRLSEAQLREEIREKDRLLHAASMAGGARKRHGL